jgi:hypothetical protein
VTDRKRVGKRRRRNVHIQIAFKFDERPARLIRSVSVTVSRQINGWPVFIKKSNRNLSHMPLRVACDFITKAKIDRFFDQIILRVINANQIKIVEPRMNTDKTDFKHL